MVKTVAEEHGATATFMPKPFSNLTGNGCHFHQSLWDTAEDRNLFLDEADENGQPREQSAEEEEGHGRCLSESAATDPCAAGRGLRHLSA